MPDTHIVKQLGRGTTAKLNLYTGPAGELLMDTTTNELVLQDGVTQGGIRIGSGSVEYTGTAPINVTGTVISLSGAVPIANGGTGSTTKNFVDLTTAQTIAGVKTFSNLPVVPTTAPTADGQVANKKYVDDTVPQPATTAPLAPASTAAVGTATLYAREDHVHPLQTTVAQLTTARSIDGVTFNGTAAIYHYGTCSTAAATVAKTVSRSNFSLATGSRITVKFTYTNTATNPTLNVNSTGAKAIWHQGGNIAPGALMAGCVYDFVYDGSYWQLIGDVNDCGELD